MKQMCNGIEAQHKTDESHIHFQANQVHFTFESSIIQMISNMRYSGRLFQCLETRTRNMFTFSWSSWDIIANKDHTNTQRKEREK